MVGKRGTSVETIGACGRLSEMCVHIAGSDCRATRLEEVEEEVEALNWSVGYLLSHRLNENSYLNEGRDIVTDTGVRLQ